MGNAWVEVYLLLSKLVYVISMQHKQPNVGGSLIQKLFASYKFRKGDH